MKTETAFERPLDEVVRLKEFIRSHQKGGCRIISKDSNCQCPLCDLDRVVAQLQWYGEIALSLSRYEKAKNDNALMACVTELMLDAGRRAFGV